MKKFLIGSGLVASLVATSLLVAADIPQLPTAAKEHGWLQQFVGEWESESKGSPGSGLPEIEFKGTMTSRMLGEFWVVSESQFDMLGTTMNAIQTIGYDSESKKYVGTWVDSMMNHMWKYEGSVDETGKILSLEAEGPNFTQPGKTAMFRDAYEFKSPHHIALTSSMQTDDGKWVTFMTGNIRRKK